MHTFFTTPPVEGFALLDDADARHALKVLRLRAGEPLYIASEGRHYEFFNDTAATEIYALALRDALPICPAICSSS